MIIKPTSMVSRVTVDLSAEHVIRCTWTQPQRHRPDIDVEMVVLGVHTEIAHSWGLDVCVATKDKHGVPRRSLVTGTHVVYGDHVPSADTADVVATLAYTQLQLCEDTLRAAVALTTAVHVLTRPRLLPALRRLCTLAHDELTYTMAVTELRCGK